MKFSSLLIPTILIGAARADYQIHWEQPIPGVFNRSATAGDFDNDGDLDLVVDDLLVPANLLLNNGNGIFEPDGNNTLPVSGASAAGDLDGDGDLDLFIAGYLSTSSVYLNDGNGAFTDSGQEIGGRDFHLSIALVDVDGDNDLDVVLPTESSTQPNKIFLNDGSGIFTDSGQELGMNFSRDVAAGDLDGDGDVDLVFAVNGRNTVWLNDGSGTFTKETTTSFSIHSTSAIALGDLDGDGDLDLYMATTQSPDFASPDEVWLNNGSGVFTDSGQSFDIKSASVGLGDLDGDGDLDALVGSNLSQPNRILLNDGSGTLSDSGFDFGDGTARGVTLGDFNGDSRIDAVFSKDANPMEVWLGSAASPFINDSGQRLGGSQTSGVVAGDLDGDGDLDAVIANSGGVTRFLFNDGSGQMADQGDPLFTGSGNNNGVPDVGDFDGDGDLDLIIPNSQQSPWANMIDRIWVNDGSGNFSEGQGFDEDNPVNIAKVADLDNDDDLDIILGRAKFSIYSGTNRILLNNGSGVFTASDGLGSANTQDISVADFNGDNHLDVFVCNGRDPHEVWFGTGTGTFTNSGQSLATSFMGVSAVADFDNDGDLDVVTGDAGGSSNSIFWRNDGSGVFTNAGLSIGRGTPRVIDADGDGDPDLWLGNRGRTDSVYLNDGSGVFSLGQSLPDRSWGGLAVGDFTGDGVDDVLVGGNEGDHALWIRDDLQTGGVSQYAAAFGLSGDDLLPGADPDGDGEPNFVEMAYNLNPTVPDARIMTNPSTATSGLPAIKVLVRQSNTGLRAQIIRRKNAPFLTYQLTVSPNLEGFSPAVSTMSSVEDIDANYERVTLTYNVPAGLTQAYARVEVSHTP